MKPYHNKDMDFLYRGILTLQTREECYAFFEDICTIKELQAMAQRFRVAAQLRDNKNYNEIQLCTGASSATISRVNKCLLYGGGGYATALDRLTEEKKNG
jgi:TrpR-related protein YerC/YecD